MIHIHCKSIAFLGWGLPSQFPPFPYFLNFSSLSKHTLAVKYRVYIWQVSPQLSCGDTCQIWMWFEESNTYFCKIENFACVEINVRSFKPPPLSSDRMRPEQNGWNFQTHFTEWKSFCNNFIQISLNFALKDPINNMSALVKVMACHRTGDKAITWGWANDNYDPWHHMWPLLLTRIKFNLSMDINNPMPGKVWDEITYPFRTLGIDK